MTTTTPQRPGRSERDPLGPDPDNPPPAGVHSLWRLRSYLRPHRGALVVMVTTALAGIGVAIAIPLVIKALIDGPITDGEIDPVLPLGLLVLALGVLEAVPHLVAAVDPVQRRAQRRDRDAARPLRPPAGAADELPQPVAVRAAALARHHRPVVDPAVLRLRDAVPVHQHPPGHRRDRRAADDVLAARPGRRRAPRRPIVWLSMRFEKEYVVVSRRVQDEQGDLATRAEEAAVAHPGDQVVRPAAATSATSTKPPPASCTRRRWTRSGSRRGSGPSSR